MQFRSHPEEGATATTFILALFALLGLALLAIDGGFLLVSRRGQIADTDSAALAAARALADDFCTSQSDLNDAADRLIRENDSEVGPASTTRVGDVEVDSSSGAACPTSAVVTVTTQRPSAMFFAPLFGFDDLKTSVSSKVAYGQGDYFERLRPIGICGLEDHYMAWEDLFEALHDGSSSNDAGAWAAYLGELTDPATLTEHPDTISTYPGAAPSLTNWEGPKGVHRIPFGRLNETSACGAAAGNFGFLDFDANDNKGCEDPDNPSANQLRCRIRVGFEGGVSLGGPPSNGSDDEDCNTEESSITKCPPDPGQIDSASAALQDLVDGCPPAALATSCEPILIVVYDNVTGSGNNAEFNLKSVASIVLRGFNLASKGQNEFQNYLDIEFVETIQAGPISSSAAGAPGGTAPIVVQACGTEGFDNC